MEFGNAALLIATVYGLVELAKAVLPDSVTGNSKLVVGLVFVLSIVAVFLIGGTVWAHEQVLGGHPLDQLGVADKLVVSLFVGGAAAFLHQGVVTTVKNIGENQPQ